MDNGTPGDPGGIRDLAQHWTDRGSSAQSAATTLRLAKNNIEGGDLRLKGDYAPKIQEAIGELPGELEKLSRGYHGCGAALFRYADTLEQAQAKSRQARDDGDIARRNKRDAELDLDQLLPGWEATVQRVGGQDVLAAESLGAQAAQAQAAFRVRQQAQNDVGIADRLAQQAAALRGDGERDCERDIKHALETSGMRNRSTWQKIGDWFKRSFTTWDGFVDLCEMVSLVLGVVALFLTGPLALLVGAILLVAAVVAMADTLKQFADGKIGWKDLALGVGMALLSRFGGRLLGSGFKLLRRTKAVKAFSNAMHSGANRLADRLKVGDWLRNAAHRGICSVTGHPVDVATGKVFTDFTDLDLPGPLPLRFERVWYSTSTYAGPLGHGWHHSYDAGLTVTADAILHRTPDGRIVNLLPLDVGDEYYERIERLTVARDETGYRLRDSDGVTYRFSALSNGDTEVATYVLTDLVNRAGHRISLSYVDGYLTEITDSGGRAIRFEHDGQGRIVAMTAPHPDLPEQRLAVARYGYDDLSDLIFVTDAVGNEMRYAYTDHLLMQETDRVGLSFYFEYDRSDDRARCLRTWGDAGIYDHRLSYQPGLTTVTNSLGHTTQHEHEGGLVVRRIDALGGESLTSYDYRQPVEETDALGRVTTRDYDYRGNEIRTVTPDGAVVAATFDDRDLPVAAVDAVGGEWSWAYDDAGLLTGRRDPLGRVWSFGYTGGLLASVADPGGGVAGLRFDEQGSVAQFTAPDGGTVGWRRDALGRPVAVTDPLGNEQRRTYDLASQVVRVDEPDGNVRELAYDGEGNLLHAVDRLYDVEFAYQGMGRLAVRTQAGTSVRFEYDTEEQLTGIVNEHGHVYRFDHGPTGEVGAERGFDGILRLYERDVLGRVVSVRRASGMVSRYTYDRSDRVAEVAHSDGTVERFGYRVDGALISAENETAVVAFERDVLGRVTRELQGPHWVASEYNALDLRVRMRSSFGLDQTIQRNVMGDVTAVAAGDFTAEFTRDALGQELTRSLPGGVHARWHRDRLGRPVRHEVTSAAGAIRDRTYDWDVDDRLRGIVDAFTGPIAYQHDALGQLAAARYADGRVELRMPDAVGNLFHTTDRTDRVYGPAGQLLESTDDTGRRIRYSYDPEGNLTSKQASDGETWTYRWNAVGYLAEVTRPDGSTVTFAYDPLGRRISKTFRGQTTRWIWDGNVPLHEWIEAMPTLEPAALAPADNGTLAHREALLSEYLLRGPPERGTLELPVTWLFQADTFAPLARLTATHQESVVTDHLGAPLAVLTGDGEATWTADLTTWGELTSITGQPWYCPFRWSGQYEDVETGLYYNRFRYYDPTAGRYVSQDPLGLFGGEHPYRYVLRPNVATDPFGLADPKDPGYFVYALFDDNTSVDPYYLGMTNRPDLRAGEHFQSGRMMGNNVMRVLEGPMSFGEARGTEQLLIEEFGTKTGTRGVPISASNRGNKVASFDKTRTDKRGSAYNKGYNAARKRYCV